MNGGFCGTDLFVLKSPIVMVVEVPISSSWAAASGAITRFRPSKNVGLGLKSGGGVPDRHKLVDLHGGIAEEVIDSEHLGQGACVGVGGLCGEHRVTQTGVVPFEKLLQ